MKKNLLRKTAAILCVCAVLATMAAAAGEGVAYNQVGVVRWGGSYLSAGDTITAPNGQQVPSVITYTDAAGGKTNYLSIRSIADMIDTPIEWDSGKNSVVFGGSPYHATSSADQFTPSGPGNSIGPITEIDPNAIHMPEDSKHDPWEMTLVANKGGIPRQVLAFLPKTIHVISITNNTNKSQEMFVSHDIPGSVYSENFSRVLIGPNETLTRAFQMSDNVNQLSQNMNWWVKAYNAQTDKGQEVVRETNITVSITQYTPVYE